MRSMVRGKTQNMTGLDSKIPLSHSNFIDFSRYKEEIAKVKMNASNFSSFISDYCTGDSGNSEPFIEECFLNSPYQSNRGINSAAQLKNNHSFPNEAVFSSGTIIQKISWIQQDLRQLIDFKEKLNEEIVLMLNYEQHFIKLASSKITTEMQKMTERIASNERKTQKQLQILKKENEEYKRKIQDLERAVTKKEMFISTLLTEKEKPITMVSNGNMKEEYFHCQIIIQSIRSGSPETCDRIFGSIQHKRCKSSSKQLHLNMSYMKQIENKRYERQLSAQQGKLKSLSKIEEQISNLKTDIHKLPLYRKQKLASD